MFFLHAVMLIHGTHTYNKNILFYDLYKFEFFVSKSTYEFYDYESFSIQRTRTTIKLFNSVLWQLKMLVISILPLKRS